MKGTKQILESLYGNPEKITYTVSSDYVALWNDDLKLMATKDEFLTDGLPEDVELQVSDNAPDVNLFKGMFYLLQGCNYN